jgi:hypothetical protein
MLHQATGKVRAMTQPKPDQSAVASLGRKTAALLVLGAFLALGAVASGHFYSIDGAQYFRVGERLLFDRSWVYDPPLVWGGPISVPITPIGFSLAYWPALFLSMPLLPYQPSASGPLYNQALLYGDPMYTASAWVNPLIASLTALVTTLLALRLGMSRRVGIVVGLAALFAGPLFFYARADFAQPLSALLLVTAVYLAVRVRQGDPTTTGAMALVVAAAILTRPVDGAIAAAAVGVILATPGKGWTRIREGVRPFLELAGGFAVGLGLTLAINEARRGSLLDVGAASSGFTGSIRWGFLAELLSPSRGLAWYLPLTLLAVVGAVALWRSGQSRVLVALAFPIIPYLLVYAKWQDLGGWCWGPRYLVPLVPLLAIMAAFAMQTRTSRHGRALAGGLFAVLALIGFVENLANVGVDQLQGFFGLYGDNTMGTPGFWRQFDPGAFAPVFSWNNYTGTPDVIWFHLADTTNGVSLLAFLALLAGAAICLGLALRSVPTNPDRSEIAPSN